MTEMLTFRSWALSLSLEHVVHEPDPENYISLPPEVAISITHFWKSIYPSFKILHDSNLE